MKTQTTTGARKGISVQLVISAHDFNEHDCYQTLSDLGGEIYVVGSKDITGYD